MTSKHKPGRTPKGKKSRKLAATVCDEDRRHFVQMMAGAAVAAGTAIDAAFISTAFAAAKAAAEVTSAEIPDMVNTAVKASNHPEHFDQLEKSLGQLGLKRVDAKVKAYRATNQNTAKTKVLTIIPYHHTDKSAHTVGAIGIAEGSPPSGVSVELDGTKMKSFTTHDVLFGKVVKQTITPEDLESKGHQAFVEKDLPRDKSVKGDITVAQAANLSVRTFKTYLAEEQKEGLYTPAQVQAFLLNEPTIKKIAQLQHARHRGLTMSHGNACCSCCTTCWGCCSCSCAVTSSYLSAKYHSRAASNLHRA